MIEKPAAMASLIRGLGDHEGSALRPVAAVLEEIINAIINWLKNHLPELTKAR